MKLLGIRTSFVFAMLSYSIASAAHGAASASNDSHTDKKLIAGGQIGTPASPSTGVIRPAIQGTSPGLKPSAPIGVFDLFPPARDTSSNGSESKVDESKPVNTATIEYDENLAPTSNMPGLSVQRALNDALVNGPRAAAVRAQLGIAMANFPQATQAPNPIFFFDRGLVAEQVNRMGPIFAMEQPWKLVFRLLIAKRLVDQSKVDLLTQIWSLRADVRRAYIELVVAQETQRTLTLLYDLSLKLFNVSEKRFQAGAVPELDVLKARLAASQAAVDVNVGKRRILQAKQQLNILLGKATDAPLNVAPLPDYTSDLPRETLHAQKSDVLPDFSRDVPPLQEYINKALNNRLELKSLALQIKLNKANLMGAYGNIIPNTSFSTGKSVSGNPSGSPKLTAVYFTVYQEIPFSNINQGLIWQYRATQRQLQYQVAAQQNQVTADVTAAYNS
ncbi:MAG: TolC family protein, partial [Candidatus Obscuribacterales bacterium]|nr:TolC family protein [Candidatus Obscuribacterales bacterium]